jgi:hypothetical protein
VLAQIQFAQGQRIDNGEPAPQCFTMRNSVQRKAAKKNDERKAKSHGLFLVGAAMSQHVTSGI